MAMNPDIAARYNTLGAGDEQISENTKVAQATLFAQAADQQGINLMDYTPEARESMFSDFVTKLAEAEGEEEEEEEDAPADDDDDEEEKSAARAEFLQQEEWREKVAQADHLGQVMAHSFFGELQEIQKEASRTNMGVGPGAPGGSGAPGRATVMGVGPGAPGGSFDPNKKGLLDRAKDVAGKAGKAVGDAAGKARGAVGQAAGHVKKHKGKYLAGAGAAAGIGAAGYAASKALGKKKESSANFDLVAAEEGLKIAAAAGWNTGEAADRLNAVLILGPGESEKVAHAGGDYHTGLQLRGLELLEVAGYPVDWDQVFGG